MFTKWHSGCSSALLLSGICLASFAAAADLDMIGYNPGGTAQPIKVGSG
nr:hypothetical protein [Ochrobactrum sp. CM-21-5]